MHLRDACHEVVSDAEVMARYPDGIRGDEILNEIQAKHGKHAFALCTVLDVNDEMRAMGLAPINRGS